MCNADISCMTEHCDISSNECDTWQSDFNGDMLQTEGNTNNTLKFINVGAPVFKPLAKS